MKLKTCPRLLFPAWLTLASHAGAELPRYSITRTADFLPHLPPPGDASFPNRTFLTSISARGADYLAVHVDYQDIFDNLDDLETPYILSSTDLSVHSTGGPPAGYMTGTSSALFASSAGHIVSSVSTAGDRGNPGWLERIQVARTEPDGTTTVLPGGQGIEQRGVNASGTVIGVGPEDFTAWRYTDALGWMSIGSLGPSGYAQPRGLNDTGLIVGRTENTAGQTVPFLWSDAGGMQAITDGGSAIFGEATAINNSGLVTGTAGGRAFLFNSATLELRYLSDTVVGVRPVDINEAGAILGLSGLGTSGFVTLYHEDFGLVSLSSLLEGNEDPFNPTWLMNDAVDINDTGWILGTAQRVSDNTFHQVLLRPVPEPSAALLLLAGGLLLRRHRRRESP